MKNSRNYITWEDILDLIRQDKSINFFAFAVSPWHALSIDATLLWLQKERHIELNGIICCASHSETGWAIDESYFESKCAQIYSLTYGNSHMHNSFKTVMKLYWKRILEYKYIFADWINWRKLPTFYFICPYQPLLLDIMRLHSVDKYVKCVTCDEGVATYMSTLKPKLNPIHSLRDIWRYRHFVRENFLGREVRAILHGDISTYIFLKEKGRLVVNNSIIPYYREVFKERCYALYKDRKFDISDAVVVCTTAWQRDEIQDNEDLRVLLLVCETIKSKGSRLLLKTHPRDTFFVHYAQQMGTEVLDEWGMSMELMCEISQPKAIVSFSSTTLIVPKVFWSISCFCLTEMLDRTKIGNRYLEEIDSFKHAFGNMVTYVQDLNDLETIKK